MQKSVSNKSALPPLPDGWREVINHLSSVNNGRNYYVHDDGTTVIVRPVALSFEASEEGIQNKENSNQTEKKQAGTVYGRQYFSERKQNKQYDIRLFSVGAPISDPAESKESELVLKAVEIEKPKQSRKSKYSLDQLTTDI